MTIGRKDILSYSQRQWGLEQRCVFLFVYKNIALFISSISFVFVALESEKFYPSLKTFML